MSDFDPTSLDAWVEKSVQIISLPNGLAVKVKQVDLVGLLSSDVQNPLLGLMMEARGGKQTVNSADAMRKQSQGLNKLLTEVIISPPLKESGHPDGISINDIKLEYKMHIFQTLMGGEYSNAERFLPTQGEDVDDGKNGTAIWEDSQPDHEGDITSSSLLD